MFSCRIGQMRFEKVKEKFTERKIESEPKQERKRKYICPSIAKHVSAQDFGLQHFEKVLFHSHLGHSSIGTKKSVHVYVVFFFFFSLFFSWWFPLAVVQTKEWRKNLPEILSAWKVQHFFSIIIYFFPVLLVVFEQQKMKTTISCFSNCKQCAAHFFLGDFLVSSLIKQTHLFPMPFILSTLILIPLFFFFFIKRIVSSLSCSLSWAFVPLLDYVLSLCSMLVFFSSI